VSVPAHRRYDRLELPVPAFERHPHFDPDVRVARRHEHGRDTAERRERDERIGRVAATAASAGASSRRTTAFSGRTSAFSRRRAAPSATTGRCRRRERTSRDHLRRHDMRILQRQRHQAVAGGSPGRQGREQHRDQTH
jgi:hypothetical protein